LVLILSAFDNLIEKNKNKNIGDKIMKEKVRLGFIASGSGTDANAIITACREGRIRNADPVLLISSKPGVGCLEKASKLGVESGVIDRKSLDLTTWRQEVERYLVNRGVELVFLVGCLVVFKPFEGIAFYNIHPADPKKHGGRKMYGLAVHKHVLLETRDEIRRGWRKVTDRFFTLVTVHEVNDQPDQGEILCQARVEIPHMIVQQLMDGKTRIGKLAARLQKHVLRYEWLILPMAVEMAAKKILDAKTTDPR
jgi:phosphoribosylglycinamide formyltransferase-1